MSLSLQSFRPYETEEKGLSGLCESYLGLPLDKRDQMSDWDKRPLSEDQISYAALDALVLLEIFEAMKKRAEAEGVQVRFDDMASALIRNKNKVK